jgi:acetyl/propionyl-CoA carboxylase alpha subunit
VSHIRPITRLAVLNRGEAAMRCIRAIKTLRAAEGSQLQAIVLYTEVDRDAPFVRHADVALHLASERGEVAAYLDHDLILDALRRSDADAVWPGWGFVAEDPAFVERLDEAGIRFLGPSAHAMRALGDKISAKRIAESAGVPVIPWGGGPVENEDAAAQQASRLGYPVLVKAAAGGGGRGILATADSSSRLGCRAAATSRCRSPPTRRAASAPSAAGIARYSGATRS